MTFRVVGESSADVIMVVAAAEAGGFLRVEQQLGGMNTDLVLTEAGMRLAALWEIPTGDGDRMTDWLIAFGASMAVELVRVEKDE